MWVLVQEICNKNIHAPGQVLTTTVVINKYYGGACRKPNLK